MTTRKLVWAWAPVAVWMGVIFWLSSRSTLPTFPGLVPDTVAKKGGHFVEYGMLAVLCWRALRLTVRSSNPAVWAFVITVFYAMSDEWHQAYVPGRNGRLADVLIDSTGALIGLAAVHLWARRKTGAGGARRPAPAVRASPIDVRDPEIADRA